MKRVKLLFILMFIILLSGCYRQEGTLTINDDKSVLLEFKVLVDDNFDESKYISKMNYYQTKNINIQRINEYGHKGYKISKQYSSIDSISGEKDITVEIYKFLDDNFNDNVLFKRKNSYFKDVYSAKFKIANFSNNQNNMTITKDDYIEEIKDLYSKALLKYSSNKNELNYNNKSNVLDVNENLVYNVNLDKKGNVILLEVKSKYYSYKKIDTKILLNDIKLEDIEIIENNDVNNIMTFVVNLPKKSISNNASRISDDGKTLTWIFNENNKNNIIEFTFDINNKSHLYLIIELFALIIICFLIIIFITNSTTDRKRKKIENNTPIYAGYDSSIEKEALTERKNIKNNIVSIKIKKKNKELSPEELIDKQQNCEIIEIKDEK